MADTPPKKPKQEFGAPVPDFSLPRVSGGTSSLQRVLEGKKGALIVFWSDTCSHCIRYDSYFNSFAEKHPELGFVAIASRKGEDLEHVKETAAQRSLSFPVLHDRDSAVAQRWFVQQTPRVFLIDPERRLLYRGAVDNFMLPKDPEYRAYLEPAIEEFLAGKPISRPETTSFGCAIQSVYYVLPQPLS